MQIKILQVGPIETNCYIVFQGNEAIVIDPGDEVEKILKELGDLQLKSIILTHLHFDHIIAARALKVKTGVKIYCCKDDLEILDENLLKKSEIDGYLGRDARPCVSTFEIIETPGHTPGSICLYDEKNGILFSGDTIFAGSIGVTHFKGGDFNKIKDSISKDLLTLPDETMVYPGHGDKFLLGKKKEIIRSILK